MTSLVGYGVSSDSESEPESREKQLEHDTKPEEDGGGLRTRNFLLESGSASSSESEQEEADKPDPLEKLHVSREYPLPQSPTSSASSKLPPPALGKSGLLSGDSVFTNPFKEQAEERLSALQKHVPLTLHARPTHIRGRKVCVAYRKDGRCRFGIGCKFAHDSDLQNPENVHMVLKNPLDCTGAVSVQEVEEPEENQRRKNKHKVGISDTLIPPKRALKQYAMQNKSSSM